MIENEKTNTALPETYYAFNTMEDGEDPLLSLIDEFLIKAVPKLPSKGQLVLREFGSCKYYMPAPLDKCAYVADEITVRVDGTEIGPREERVYRCCDKPNGACSVSVNAETSSDVADDEADGSAVGMYLYRRGHARPVASYAEVPGYLGCDWNFPRQFRKLTPGDYFFLFENLKKRGCHHDPDKPLTVAFKVLNHGAVMRQPRLRDARVAIRPADDGRLRLGTLVLDLVFEKRLNENCHEFSAACLDRDSMMVMNDKSAAGYSDEVCRSDFRLCLPNASRVWIDGAYYLLVSSNRHPMWRIDFEISAGAVSNVSTSLIQPGTADFTLAQSLPLDERGDRQLASLLSVPGYRPVKEDVLEAAAFGDGVGAYPHTVLYANNDEDFLESMSSLLERKFGSAVDDRACIDCEDVAARRDRNTPNDFESDPFPSAEKAVVVLTHISSMAMPQMMNFVKSLQAWLDSHYTRRAVLIGAESEVKQLSELYPRLGRLFPGFCRIPAAALTSRDAVHFIMRAFAEDKVAVSDEAVDAICANARVTEAVEARNWNQGRAKDFVRESVLPRFYKRQRREPGKGAKDTIVKAADIDLSAIMMSSDDGYEQSMAELRGMIGLMELKERLESMLRLTRFDSMRRRAGIDVSARASYHMVFTGNPGTGKTTVAKCIGRVLHSVGVLSVGDVVAVDRSSIVGKYIGDTEDNMRRILAKARGNVLFIDEAYSLMEGSAESNDFGRKAVECLLTELCRPNPDMVVILAGYTREMEVMLDTNSGLRSRFPLKFEFPDYSVDDLTAIADKMLDDERYTFTDAARDEFRLRTEAFLASRPRNFGNGRWVEQTLHHGVIPAMVDRVLAIQSPTVADMTVVTAADVEAGFHRIAPRRAAKPGLGFSPR